MGVKRGRQTWGKTWEHVANHGENMGKYGNIWKKYGTYGKIMENEGKSEETRKSHEILLGEWDSRTFDDHNNCGVYEQIFPEKYGLN